MLLVLQLALFCYADAPIAVKFLAVQVRYQLDRLCEKRRRITNRTEGKEYSTYNEMKEG